jgi:hypothetical protein
MRLHGEMASEVAGEASKKARRNHQPVTVRYWSLVAIAISRNDVFPHKVTSTPLAFVDAVIEKRRCI